MSEFGDFRTKPRSATASNIEETILEIPGGRTERASSVLHPPNHASHHDTHGSTRKLSNPFNWRFRKHRKSQDFSTTSLAVAQKNNTVSVARPVYNQHQFDSGFARREQEEFDFKGKMKKCFTCDCSKTCWKDFLYKFFPFVTIMGNYSLSDDLTGDIVAGLTVGIMNIPQGMAYALLASMPPIYGLYVSFFPPLVYFFLGGSRHISVGTFAVVSLMVGSAVEGQLDACKTAYLTTSADDNFINDTMDMFNDNSSSTNDTSTPNEKAAEDTCKIWIATSLTLLVGLCQIMMGILKLGFVTIYLADPLISGFTTGAACHVFTSQVKFVLGIKVQRHNGAFKLIYTYIDLFTHIAEINWAELITAATCIICLVLVKECINDRCKSKMKMPVPIDLIVVVLGTVISFAGNFSGNFGVSTLGEIPRGFPAPTAPALSNVSLGGLMPNVFTISVISFAVSVSMSKIFAKKHNYEIDSDQELLAHGFSNVFGSFFLCFTACASLSRSAVQDNQGGKSQVASLLSCVLILIVMTAIGPYFRDLPNSVLAAIILVALKGMFRQFQELKRLWYISYYDFSIWLVTWLAVVILDVDLGLGVGVVFGLLTVVFRTQYPNTTILARVPHTDLYKDKGIYPTVQEVPSIKIFRIDASLYYANVEHFRKKLYKLTEVNPRTIKLERAKLEAKVAKEVKTQKKAENLRKRRAAKVQGDEENEQALSLDLVGAESETVDIIPAMKREGWPKPGIHHIIIDCSMMSYVDSVGVNMLRSVYQEYKDVDIEVFLVNCKVAVRDMFEKCSFYEKVSKENIYLTIHDGVIAALLQKREILEEVNRDTKIVSRPSSVYSGSDRNVANLMMNRRPSQPLSTGLFKPRGSLIPNLPPQGEDSEMAEDAMNEHAEDSVNGEVSKGNIKSNSNGNILQVSEANGEQK
ncbi:prestin-like isoform X2 [Watersipora subatra]|uniref:prestin-like isoform X2 n=1 Tax=Watersipora subatra TaxID=2589382 RepID=UPI00355C5921